MTVLQFLIKRDLVIITLEHVLYRHHSFFSYFFLLLTSIDEQKADRKICDSMKMQGKETIGQKSPRLSLFHKNRVKNSEKCIDKMNTIDLMLQNCNIAKTRLRH
ncbi:hypothetical protein C0674_05530 [Sporolactobacillus terrae]|uniref:Uncharacterized protein n=1 Tax=Sporolactobacillus terrae TaxID=269673 RepID=A0ABX5Q644_9BACL|nr:hypothetical protein C0674_05530 [Sporolactobacillus terrae]QAA25092.1 hypothetical protein C0679_05505 [Sporolactobacillus terrae]